MTSQAMTAKRPGKSGRDKERIPRILLAAIAGVCLITLALVSLARIADLPPSAMPPSDVPVVAERSIRLYGSMNGAAKVLDTNGGVIADLGPTEGGFIAGVWRSLARKRMQMDVAVDAPVRLVSYADKRLALFDDHTGWRVELIGFGKDNTAAFAKLLEK
ncbi:MAG: photosynthetic complex assembly protein PuhC [Pseudomonadota bacterium]